MPNTRPTPTTMSLSDIGTNDTITLWDQQKGLRREVAANLFSFGSTNETVTGDKVFSGALTVTGTAGFFGATAVGQQSTTGTTTGFTAGSGTAVNDDSTFTGDEGTTAYTIGDIVNALKTFGLLESTAA